MPRVLSRGCFMDCKPHTLSALHKNALKLEFQLLLLKDPILTCFSPRLFDCVPEELGKCRTAAKEAPKRGELLVSVKVPLKEHGWKFSPSLATPNPCVQRRMKNWSLSQLSLHKLQENLQLCAWMTVFQCLRMKDSVALLQLLRTEWELEKTEQDSCKLESSTDEKLSNLRVIYPSEALSIPAVCLAVSKEAFHQLARMVVCLAGVMKLLWHT